MKNTYTIVFILSSILCDYTYAATCPPLHGSTRQDQMTAATLFYSNWFSIDGIIKNKEILAKGISQSKSYIQKKLHCEYYIDYELHFINSNDRHNSIESVIKKALYKQKAAVFKSIDITKPVGVFCKKQSNYPEWNYSCMIKFINVG